MPARILVVGRDVHAREGLRSILSSDGHEVDVARDIWEGFARVAAQAFDLLLLDDDVRLDGHTSMIVADLLAFARLQHPATCGIVISSFVDGVPRYRREDGVLTVFEKPVEVRRLRLELESLTCGRTQGPGS
jgi:DNA-binding NtrC family response regulator